jgi:PiT family inorganic phosphate transporter
MPRLRIHLLEVDAWTRAGLLAVGGFGAFSLGQNNIANVMGVFVGVSPFPASVAVGPLRITSVEMLFLSGGVAIATGIYTFSHGVMRRLGAGLTSLSPLAALVVVFSTATVLFLFASPNLERLLLTHGLPALPLVPVSSSQAVVGAILGISLVRRSRIRFRALGAIAAGWVVAPLAALVFSLVGLFAVQNLFELPVSSTSPHRAAAATVAPPPVR